MAVKRVQSGDQGGRQVERIEILRLPAPLFRHFLPDMLPEIAEHRRLPAGNVIGDRHARQLDDATFNCVHQREIAHRPRKERSLLIAGTAQKEGRGGKVHHRG